MCENKSCEFGSRHSSDGCCENEDCRCGRCDCGHNFHRRYQTKAEKIADLEAYQSELQTELQAVEEMLADLRK